MTKNNIEIRLADWENDRATLSTIRRRVFIEEQSIPEDMEWDEFDATSCHFLAFENQQAIACARLKADGQIGRMAVLPDFQNRGTGKKLLQFVLQTASEQDFDEVYLHAQVSAISFYEKHGFISQGEIFYEADISHRKMLKKSAKDYL